MELAQYLPHSLTHSLLSFLLDNFISSGRKENSPTSERLYFRIIFRQTDRSCLNTFLYKTFFPPRFKQERGGITSRRRLGGVSQFSLS